MTDPVVELGKVAGAVIAAVGGLALLWKAARGMLGTIRKIGWLVDEVVGDGDKRPGWGRRLTAIEDDGRNRGERLTAIERRLSGVEAQLQPNGGASMKDQIGRIEKATGATRDEETS